jgi:hypothetical protein
VGTTLSYHLRALSVARIRPNTACPKQFEQTTNRYSTQIPGAAPYLCVPAL